MMVCLSFSMRSLARIFLVTVVFSFVNKVCFHISYKINTTVLSKPEKMCIKSINVTQKVCQLPVVILSVPHIFRSLFVNC